jgi:hypothetical protein
MAKKPADPRGGHVRIYWELIDSMAWRALDWSSVGLYVAMRRKLQSTNNGNLSCTLGDMKHYGMGSSATLAKALKALQAVGLISMTRQGGIAFGQKVCSLYRFTDEQVFEQPKVGVKASAPTHEWRQFTTLGQAKAAIHAAHATTKNASGLQKLKRVGSKNEASTRFNASEVEAVASPLVQKLKQPVRRQPAATPHKH